MKTLNGVRVVVKPEPTSSVWQLACRTDPRGEKSQAGSLRFISDGNHEGLSEGGDHGDGKVGRTLWTDETGPEFSLDVSR